MLEKIRFVIRLWVLAGIGWWRMKRKPLPDLVIAWSAPRPHVDVRDPRHLSRIVDRVLKIGRMEPRCIVRAMVLYRLLAEQGDLPVLVIGMSEEPLSTDTHAWVEIEGRDFGPRPGRGQLTALASFDQTGAR